MANRKYDRNDIINAYLKHRSIAKAAKEIGCSKSTISNVLKQNGINASGDWKTSNTARPPNTNSSLVDAITSGNKRDMLIAVRDKLAAAIDSCESDRDLPALTKRFWEVQKELESLPDRTKKLSKHDRLKARYEKR